MYIIIVNNYYSITYIAMGVYIMLLSILKERWNKFKHPSTVKSDDKDISILPVYHEDNSDVKEETLTTMDVCLIALLGLSAIAILMCIIF